MDKKLIGQPFYGDDLNVIHEKTSDNSINLIYLNPPFNSTRNYNHIYSTAVGISTNKYIAVFRDMQELIQEKKTAFESLAKYIVQMKMRDLCYLRLNRYVCYQNPKISSYLVL